MMDQCWSILIAAATMYVVGPLTDLSSNSWSATNPALAGSALRRLRGTQMQTESRLMVMLFELLSPNNDALLVVCPHKNLLRFARQLLNHPFAISIVRQFI